MNTGTSAHRWISATGGAVMMCLATSPAAAQADAPVDTDGIAAVTASPRMSTRLEKTIFKVDVLTVELRFDAATDRRLHRAIPAGAMDEASADSIVATVLAAEGAVIRVRFERSISLDQFLDGLQDSARRARDAGIILPSTFEDIIARSPAWYGFLADRRILDGDEMFYRIRGDTLRTVYRGLDGAVLLDQVDVGRQNVLAVLGGYLAPKSDFRNGLLRSLSR